jgi:CheY-like chemotaxis protein/ketosteroid isomerase-like protein
MFRLLLIEDDVDSLEILQLLLQTGGFAVVGVPSKAEAVRELERGAFDLVLADLLVGSNEIESAWNAIAELAALARPALVGLITGWPVSDELAAKHGVAFVLQKPCMRDTLFGQLARSLGIPALTTDQQTTVEAYFGALERQEYETLAELCTDDVVYQLPGSDGRFAQEIHGRSAFLQFTNETFKTFAAPRFEVSAIRPLPSGALVEYVGHWNQANEDHEMPGAVMFELKDDRISRIAVRVNTDKLA